METVTLTIDGKPVTVEKGKTVLQAVLQSGGHVPYYCYHPGLKIDGSCRVCIVKIEKMPKLQTSCSTFCTDGMVVSTNTPDVEAARAWTTSGVRVWTTMPSAHIVEQEVCSFGIFSIFTMQTRQDPSIPSPG